MDPTPVRPPVRRGPVPRGLLGGIAVVSLGLGVGIGWLLFGSGPSGDLAAMCTTLATVEDTDLSGVEATGDAVDPVVYRVSAISDLALAAGRDQPDLDEDVAEAGADIRRAVAQRDVDALTASLATLRESC